MYLSSGFNLKCLTMGKVIMRHLNWTALMMVLLTAVIHSLPNKAWAEKEEEKAPLESNDAPTSLPPKTAPKEKKRFFVEDPGRIDAGSFHVAFVGGGNFYIEPMVDKTTRTPLGEYFKDFGFQGGVIFDYDYEDVPLGLRGFGGYKYILSSVHVFGFDGTARILFPFSDNAKFGLGTGISAAIWYRSITATSDREEVFFLPSLVIEAGFDFHPFMTDFKWLINRIGEENTIMGFELYFGIRI